ncbi:ATP-dependent DNA helicase, partial [Clostridium tertium]
MKKKKRISIRNLVEFIMKHGSIDNTISSNIKPIEGTRAHQMIQKSDENYSAEVSLKYEFEHNDIKIRVEGRADGILIENNEIIIDEIKTTLKDVNSYNDEINNLHLAQVKCYGYIYCFENQLDSITLQLTYY